MSVDTRTATSIVRVELIPPPVPMVGIIGAARLTNNPDRILAYAEIYPVVAIKVLTSAHGKITHLACIPFFGEIVYIENVLGYERFVAWATAADPPFGSTNQYLSRLCRVAVDRAIESVSSHCPTAAGLVEAGAVIKWPLPPEIDIGWGGARKSAGRKPRAEHRRESGELYRGEIAELIKRMGSPV